MLILSGHRLSIALCVLYVFAQKMVFNISQAFRIDLLSELTEHKKKAEHTRISSRHPPVPLTLL